MQTAFLTSFLHDTAQPGAIWNNAFGCYCATTMSLIILVNFGALIPIVWEMSELLRISLVFKRLLRFVEYFLYVRKAFIWKLVQRVACELNGSWQDILRQPRQHYIRRQEELSLVSLL